MVGAFRRTAHRRPLQRLSVEMHEDSVLFWGFAPIQGRGGATFAIGWTLQFPGRAQTNTHPGAITKNRISIVLVCHSSDASAFLAIGFTLRHQITTGAVVLCHRQATRAHIAALLAASASGVVFYGRTSGDLLSLPARFAAAGRRIATVPLPTLKHPAETDVLTISSYALHRKTAELLISSRTARQNIASGRIASATS